MADLSCVVTVHKAFGQKCERCYKRLEEVDSDPVFWMTCHRCSQQMHTLFYDVTHGHKSLLPPALREETEQTFIRKFTRSNLGLQSWQEAQELFKDFGYEHKENQVDSGAEI